MISKDEPNKDLGNLVAVDTIGKLDNNQSAFMLHVFSIGQGKVRNVLSSLWELRTYIKFML